MAKYDGQNAALSLAVTIAGLFLLWFASHSEGIAVFVAAVLFAFLGLTNYALIHEACHHNLNSDAEKNARLGTLVSWLLPVSFTFMETVHGVHHRNNRTDGEMFDYYYPDDNRVIKFGQWYSILIGIYPPIIPLGSVLMGFVPWVFRWQPWQTAKSSSILFDRGHFSIAVVRKIRREVIGGMGFWLAAWLLLDLNVVAVAILYGAFWFNWSTRQYVSHAFSPRDVLNGAWNLRVSRLMGWIFLNGQWDLVHHNDPTAHWQELASLGERSASPIPYWPQYLRLWAGPRPNSSPAPQPLAESP